MTRQAHTFTHTQEVKYLFAMHARSAMDTFNGRRLEWKSARAYIEIPSLRSVLCEKSRPL